VPKLSILLSRTPLAGSGVGEWLATTGHMNHTHVHVHWQRIYQIYPRIPLWRIFPHLIGIWYTYGNKTVSSSVFSLWSLHYTCKSVEWTIILFT